MSVCETVFIVYMWPSLKYLYADQFTIVVAAANIVICLAVLPLKFLPNFFVGVR